MAQNKFRIAVIPGDGIGKEIIPVGQALTDQAAQICGFSVEWTTFDWSCDRYVEKGAMMPDDAIEQLKQFDAIFLGAIGWPTVPDHESLWNSLIPMRRELDLYANIRPVRLLKGIESPLRGREAGDIDFIVVRENVEGEYSSIGGRLYGGTEQEQVSQLSVFTRRGCDRIMRYAFEMAKIRPRKLVTSATKSNGIMHTMPYWDERFKAVAAQYPDIKTNQFHIDILTAHFVQHPDWFDVVVGSNLFGDILSDLGPAVTGSIGIAAGANINPERIYPSLFEPVHGSAPDIAGKGIANPIATVWTAAMMMAHLGQTDCESLLMQAIEGALQDQAGRTADLGGKATTADCQAVLAKYLASSS